MNTEVIAWSALEELAFDEIMKAGNLDRMQSIRLFRRNGSDLAKALTIARDNRREPKPRATITKAAQDRRPDSSKMERPLHQSLPGQRNTPDDSLIPSPSVISTHGDSNHARRRKVRSYDGQLSTVTEIQEARLVTWP
jgi:hypothetical protein